MDALSMFASQWLYGEKDLEEVFDEIGETVETFVFVARFSGKKNDAFFVVPYIHYGPFGNLGGSEFTHKIASALSENEKREVLVFHGTATHDFNPVSSSEIDNVVGACRKAIAAMKPKNELISLVEARDGSVRARLMKIGKCAMLSFSRAPLTTEDVSFGIGLTLLEKASKSSECACVIDEHNAETGDITSVELGSPIGFEMLSAADKALGRNARMEDFRFGCASSKVAAETMGSAGLKLALFERGKRLDAILLADSNSITPQFREQVLASIKSEAKKAGYECNAEVMTTDTHQINTVKGVINPLGEESGEAVLGAITKMMPEAIGKLEAVKFGASQQKFSIRVFGTGQSAEIASTINAVVSVLRLALPIILVGSIVLLLWGLARI
jgi:putative membrane protein